ncbi:WG repeat-containing protein [Haliscomenobacter sp.]|uniref:WG repeat-containing protein n=1 Tax=Haliscomenobacter sp. TaxID=2717303 RepID=UPI003BA9714A
MEANKFVNASINNDIETMLPYMHPEVVKMIGGVEALKKVLKGKGKKTTPSEFKFTLSSPGEIIIEDQIAQCALYYDLLVKSADSSATYHSNIIALSAPNTAKKWYFIDAVTISLESIRFLYPFISKKLEYQDITTNKSNRDGLLWKIQPFLKAKHIEEYDSLVGQVVFQDYGKSGKELMFGIADVQGNILVSPEYENIKGLRNKWQLSLDLDNSVWAYKKEPKETFENPYKNYNLWMDSIKLKSGLMLIGKSRDSFEVIARNKVLGYVTPAIIPFDVDAKFIELYKNGSYYLMNQRGEIVIPANKFSTVYEFKNGYSSFAKLKQSETPVLIDTLGNILKKLDGLEFGDASKHFFSVGKKGEYPSKMGIIDRDGKELIAPQFERIEFFGDRFFIGKKNDKWMFFNLKGERILDEEFEWVNLDGDYLVSSNPKKQKMYLFDKDLKLVQSYASDGIQYVVQLFIDPKTKEPFVSFVNGFGNFVMYNKEGKALTDPQSDCDGGFIPGGVLYKKAGKIGLASNGYKKELPPIFSGLEFLASSNTLWGKIDGKWGLLDW